MNCIKRIVISLLVVLATTCMFASNAFAVDDSRSRSNDVVNFDESQPQIAEGDSTEPLEEDSGIYNN